MKASIRRILAVASTSVLELFRRKDIYTALILGLVVLLPLASVNIFGVEGVVRYLREVALMLIWIFSAVIAVTNAARQIPSEVQRRTIEPLLAKPLGRGEFVIGKFLGAASAVSLALLLFYSGYFLFNMFKAGQSNMAVFMQAVVLHLLFVCLVTAVALLGSLILNPSANITCCILGVSGILLFGDRLSQMAADSSVPASWVLWGTHFLMPHFEFFDLRLRLIHEWGPIDAGTFLAVIAYAILYTLAALVAGMLVFRRKSF